MGSSHSSELELQLELLQGLIKQYDSIEGEVYRKLCDQARELEQAMKKANVAAASGQLTRKTFTVRRWNKAGIILRKLLKSATVAEIAVNSISVNSDDAKVSELSIDIMTILRRRSEGGKPSALPKRNKKVNVMDILKKHCFQGAVHKVSASFFLRKHNNAAVCPLYCAPEEKKNTNVPGFKYAPCAMEYASFKGLLDHLKRTGVHMVDSKKKKYSLADILEELKDVLVDAFICKFCNEKFTLHWHFLEHLLAEHYSEWSDAFQPESTSGATVACDNARCQQVDPFACEADFLFHCYFFHENQIFNFEPNAISCVVSPPTST